jgi:N utilization substance protein A
LVKGLFALEVPEIQSNAVEIREIAREAGGRCKVAVASSQDGIDPVGSLVGQKGVRVQAVINELGEEKIDIILHSGDPARFIAAALSPAKDVEVELNEEEKTAKVKVSDNQLSLAIGKGGQNVRLAAKLTGWKIDIEGTGMNSDGTTPEPRENAEEKKSEEVKADEEVKGETPSEAVEHVEEAIDEATKEESVDGATQEEPTSEEAGEAVADAEADMAADPEMNDKSEGDLMASGEQSDTGVSESAGDGSTSSPQDVAVTDESEFDKIEEERNAKEAEAKADTEEK